MLAAFNVNPVPSVCVSVVSLSVPNDNTAESLISLILLPTDKSFAIPAPPLIIKAPDVDEPESVILLILTTPFADTVTPVEEPNVVIPSTPRVPPTVAFVPIATVPAVIVVVADPELIVRALLPEVSIWCAPSKDRVPAAILTVVAATAKAWPLSPILSVKTLAHLTEVVPKSSVLSVSDTILLPLVIPPVWTDVAVNVPTPVTPRVPLAVIFENVPAPNTTSPTVPDNTSELLSALDK